MRNTLNIKELQEKLKNFATERDWEKFHSPKNLSMALSCEVAELLEIFQWLTEEESRNVTMNSFKKSQVEDEIADILLYTFRITSILNLDVNHILEKKMAKNTQKYPVDLVKGKSKKYNEY